jgi:hypothetical protein
MSDPIIIQGEEQSQVDPALADAGLPPAVGVHSYQVFRASKATKPDNGKGWTYHHHVDMACWKGRLYVGWNSCERDEDVWPSRELYASSTDGKNWTEPAEMFPQSISTCLRIYFYLATNGRMLIIAGLRRDTTDTDEDSKGGLVVRELRADHTLGPVFKLRKPETFEESNDAGFIDACGQLLADNVYLEQQDRGRLLGDRRMKWHDPANWPGGKVPGDNEKWVAGKAYSFFRRPDGLLVGVSKMGWVTTSTDDGNTWSQPAVPSTLVTGKAKVWTQQTRDGRFALVYNPSTRQRFPLIVVTGDDGITFSGMRIVQGELPRQRYPGLHRSVGPQYVRGISTWSGDGSRKDEQAMWLVYSINKEDIWVSRVPLPVKADADGKSAEWNIYSPKWAPVTVAGDVVTLEDRDPYDYARATRVFSKSREEVTISFEVTAQEMGDGSETLEIDLLGSPTSTRPVRLRVANPRRGKPISYVIKADASKGRYTVTRDGMVVTPNATFVAPCEALDRISFRTGGFRNLGGTQPVEAESDRPHDPLVFTVSDLRVESAG